MTETEQLATAAQMDTLIQLTQLLVDAFPILPFLAGLMLGSVAALAFARGLFD